MFQFQNMYVKLILFEYNLHKEIQHLCYVMQHWEIQFKSFVVPNIQIQTVGIPTDTTYYINCHLLMPNGNENTT